MKTILTVGVFDLLHIGHVELFRKAKALGDHLIVAVQDSDYVAKYKPGSKTVYPTAERAYIVNALQYVDEVVVYKDVADIPGQVDFDVFVKGPDQNHEGFKAVESFCKANNKEVYVMPRTEGISTSELKTIIREMN